MILFAFLSKSLGRWQNWFNPCAQAFPKRGCDPNPKWDRRVPHRDVFPSSYELTLLHLGLDQERYQNVLLEYPDLLEHNRYERTFVFVVGLTNLNAHILLRSHMLTMCAPNWYQSTRIVQFCWFVVQHACLGAIEIESAPEAGGATATLIKRIKYWLFNLI